MRGKDFLRQECKQMCVCVCVAGGQAQVYWQPCLSPTFGAAALVAMRISSMIPLQISDAERGLVTLCMVGRPPPGRAETAAEIQGDGQKQQIFRPESQDLCRGMTHLNSEVVSLLVQQRVEKIRFQYLIKRFRRFGGTIFGGGIIHSGNNREHLGRCSEPFFNIVRPLIWKPCTINMLAAQTDTTSQRTVPQAGVGTSSLCKTTPWIRVGLGRHQRPLLGTAWGRSAEGRAPWSEITLFFEGYPDFL